MFDPWVGKIPLEEGMATYSMEYSFLKNPIDGHEFEQALGIGDGHGSLVCSSPWGHRV